MAQLGQGSGSGYPTSIDTSQTWQNGDIVLPDGNTRIDAELVNDFAAAILNIQTTMGANPAGAYASVRARLDAIFDQVVSEITVDPVAGRATGKTTTNVLTSSGAGSTVLLATAAVPAGVILLGVTAQVLVTCGNSGGLTGWMLGDADMVDRWGAGISRIAPTPPDRSTNAGMWRSYTPTPMPAAIDILLTAEGGTWDATGEINVTAHWETFAADT